MREIRLELVHDFDAMERERIVAIWEYRGSFFLVTDHRLYRIQNPEDSQKLVIQVIKTLNYREICEALE